MLTRRPPDRYPSPELGNKAGLLVMARDAGLPVPPFIVVGDDERLGPDGFTLPHQLRGGVVAVRSAFVAEDTEAESNAGRFRTELNVEAADAAVADAVRRVRQSGESGTTRHVLVMRQVAPVRAGVAFSEAGFEDDLVNTIGGLADRLVDGQEAGDSVRLARVRHRWDRAARPAGPDLERLAHLLRRVRTVFGDLGWDIEWADDGEVCWLIQLRPVTAAPMRNETFTLANHKEILPELPSVFMTSRIEASADRLLSFYADIDSSLPINRPFVETFAGRPYLNLSMLTDMMRALGLPSELVTQNYGGEPDVHTPLRPTRLLARPHTLLKLALGQFKAVGRSSKRSAELREMSSADVLATASFAETIDIFGTVYEGLVQEMGALASALAPPVALLRRTGTLDQHLATQRTAAAQMLDDLEAVRSGRRNLSEWMDDHGHRGIFESDIARPRFVDDPTPIERALAQPERGAGSRNSSIRSVVTLPVWWVAQRPMRARETLRSETMRSFLAIRNRLVSLAEAAAANGQLPTESDLWLLTIDEAAKLDDGASYPLEHFNRIRERRAEQLEIRVPDTLRRFDDPARARSIDDRTRFVGIPLVPGTVEGKVLRCNEPPIELPDGFHPESTVLLARSVDAGWVPIFSSVAGVAVEIGGDLSHGSIILRELGIPSITNMGEVGPNVATGDFVELAAGAGSLTVQDRMVDVP